MKNSAKFAALAAAVVSSMSASADVFEQTGGTVTDLGYAELYTWTSTAGGNTLTVPDGGATVNLLVVGGGGAGGFCRGGGGGGGGVVYTEGLELAAGTYTITIGAGGVPDSFTKGVYHNDCYQQRESSAGTDGGASSVSNATQAVSIAYGGGGGGTFCYNRVSESAGRPGASGGGAAGKYTTAAVGTQGHDGGVAINNDNTSAGGGGAGAAGQNAVSATQSGAGGVGVECMITGEPVYYGGGGGGGNYGGTGGLGGLGGGGNGTGGQNTNHTAGTDGLGGGGGGASGGGNKWEYCGGKAGGSGVVIVRVATADLTKPIQSSEITAVTSRKTTVQISVVSVGEDKSQTVDVYAAIALDGDVAPMLSKIAEGVENNGQCTYVFDVLYDRDYIVYTKIVNPTTGYESDVAQLAVSTPERALVTMPGVVGWNKGVDRTDSTSDTSFRDPWALFEGDPHRFMTMAYNPSDMKITYDTGDIHNLVTFRFYSYDQHSPGRAKNMKVYGSSDNSNWTLVHDQGGVNPAYDEWTTVDFANPGSYRYYKIESLEYGQMGEIEFLTDDTLLKSERPCPWGVNYALGAADAADGVKVAGTLKFAYAGSATVFGYYADQDYDNDATAWARHGTRFNVGTVQEGASFSVNVPIQAKGVHYLRLFAQNTDDSIVASQRSEVFVVGGRPYCPKAYTNYADASKGVRWYDGNVSNFGDDNGNGHDLVFDLASIPEGFRVASMRVWPRIDNSGAKYWQWSRSRTGEILASDTDAVFSGTAISAGTNDVTSVSSMPSQTWTHVAYLNDWIQEFDPKVQEIVLPKEVGNSKYLKLTHVSYNQLCDVELRLCRIGGKGTVIVLY